ncbi:hypothetical protein Droror1_Dr00020436 [Drosera rotundifolia]
MSRCLPRSGLKDVVLEGGDIYQRVHRTSLFQYMNKDPAFNKIFNVAMTDYSVMTMKKILDTYKGYNVNEWIQTKIEGYNVSGTVEHVGWWSPTIIRGEDREAVHIPNHKFTVNVVQNLSQKSHWRIKTHLALSHLDVNKINNIVADMKYCQRILKLNSRGFTEEYF